MQPILKSSIQQIPLKNKGDIQLYIKREDLIHPFISGNKYRKLKYNIERALELKMDTLLTFGGAYSNHIAATAFAGKENGLKTIGVIRGEELVSKIDTNSTLSYAKSCGMQLHFVTREDYRKKADVKWQGNLKTQFGDFYLIPEGGTNELAINGCKEILNNEDVKYDYICTSVGTGGTITGLINTAESHQIVLGFPALKGDFLREDIRKFAETENWDLITDYHFGGYGKIKPELITFINNFKNDYTIPLDPIYTGKMMFGIFDLVKKNYFRAGSKILMIHTGGLQGISGMNLRLKKKGLPLIEE